MNQYIREWSIHINGEPYLVSQDEANLRVVFDIDVSVGNAVATADIRIYNLKEKNNINQGQTIQLKAGYKDKSDTIFSGVISNTYKERQGADIATRLLCRSGAAINDRGTANGNPYGPNVKVTDVIKDLARQWPLALEMDDEQFKDTPLMSSGYTAQGNIPTILDALAYQYKFKWIQQLGTLIIEKDDEFRKTAMFDIDMLNGMVGIPEVTRGPSGMGVYVTTRINPYIRVNSRINVQSRFSTYSTGNQYWIENEENLEADGEYNVFRLSYEGDTHGDAWNLNIDGMKPKTAIKQKVVAETKNELQQVDSGVLVWGAAVSQEFRNEVRKIAKEQKLDPNWYMAIMALETGRSFKASQPNLAGGSARGLIQFMPAVARDLGTTSQQLVLMTDVQQLEYVKRYFAKYRSKIRSFADMYMAVLWPVATGAPIDTVIWERGTSTDRQYRANSGLDISKDGKITKKEAFTKVQGFYNEGIAKSK